MVGMEPVVIYEDEDVLVVNKPAGLLVHATAHSTDTTLVDWLLGAYPELIGVGEPQIIGGRELLRPGIVHRLDRETSGLIVIAKNQNSYRYLKEQFKNHQIKKTYRLIVVGQLPAKTGTIDWPIARSLTNPNRRVARPPAAKREEKKRPAVTDWKVLKENGDYSYVEAYPQTGRTHQLRAHFLALGCPVVCDSLYAPKRACPAGLSRLALHAYKIELVLPSGKRVKLEAELPNDFKVALAGLDLA